MPGRKDEVYDRSYITDERAYRVGIAAADAALGDIPIINLDLDMDGLIRNPAANTPVKYQPSYHGHDAVIAIHALMSNQVSTATLQFWRRATDVTGVVATFWCLAATSAAITGNTLVRMPNLIAGKYRVMVSAFSAGGETLTLLQSQTV